MFVPPFSKVREARPPQDHSYTNLMDHLVDTLDELEKTIQRRRPLSSSENSLHKSLCIAKHELFQSLKTIRLLRLRNVRLSQQANIAEENFTMIHKDFEQANYENAELHQKVEEKDTYIGNLIDEKTNLNVEISGLKEDLANTEKGSADSQTRISELLQQNSTLQTELTEYKSREPELGTRINELEASLTGANNVISEKSAEVVELKRHARECESRYLVDKLNEYNHGFEKGSKSQERTISQITSECDKYKKALEKQDQKLNELELRIMTHVTNETKSSTEIAALGSKLKLAERELDEEKARVAKLQDEVKRLKSQASEQLSEHKRELDDLQHKHSKARKQAENYREELDQSTKKCDVIESARRQLDSKLSSVSDELKDLQRSFYDNNIKFTHLQEKCESFQRTIDSKSVTEKSLQETILKHQQTISRQSMRLEEADSVEFQRIQSQLQIKTEEYNQLKAAEQAVRKEYTQRSTEWDALNVKLNSEIETLSARVNALDQEVGVYRANESSSDAQIRKHYEDHYNKCADRIVNEANYYFSLKDKEIADLKQRNEYIKETHQQACSELSNVQMQLEQLRTQLKSIAPNEQRIPELLSQVSDLSRLKTEHLSQIDGLNIRIRTYESRITGMEKMLTQFTEIQGKMDANSREIEALQSELKSAKISLSEAESQNSGYLNQINALENKLGVVSSSSIDEFSYVKEISQLKTQLSATFHKLSELETAKGSANAELSVVKRHHQELLERVVPLIERQEILIARLRFIKAIYNHYCPLDESIKNAFPRQKRTLKQVFLFGLAIAKFKNAGSVYKEHSQLNPQL